MLRDQAKRGQVLIMLEVQAKRFPNLMVASLGALQKEKMEGVVPRARVHFDGTNDDDESALWSVCRPASDPKRSTKK